MLCLDPVWDHTHKHQPLCRSEEKQMKVRMMLPMSVRCNTCGTYMYKGTKFNTRMEDVKGEDYLGIKIFRFYYRCTACSAEFCMKTDPKNTDYVVEGGATRNYEPWREREKEKLQSAVEREEEERGNAMKALENRTLDSRREMDMMAALDEMISLKVCAIAVDADRISSAFCALQSSRLQLYCPEFVHIHSPHPVLPFSPAVTARPGRH